MQELIRNVFTGNTRAIARMISLVEERRAPALEAMTEIYRQSGKAHIIGLTGVPGSGKSTLLSALILAFRRASRRVGVIAVDPSSPYTGGAILGDRIRMTGHPADEGVFIRSLASRGNLGGLAQASLDVVDILDASGFDLILIETVGVGQDEVDIANASHTVVVISSPGLGDEVQAIKAGVLEIADIHVISKADKLDANQTAVDLRAMLNLGLVGRDQKDWSVPVISTSAKNGNGIDKLMAKIEDHWTHLVESGDYKVRQRQIAETRIIKLAEEIIRSRVAAERNYDLQAVLEDTIERTMDPRSAARKLLQNWQFGLE